MKVTRNLLTRLFVLMFAACAVASAVAQGPRGAGGAGGPGGPGGGVAPLAVLLLDTQVYAALGLTTAQQDLWTALQAAEQYLRTQQAAARTALRTLITTQLASGAPDLVAIEDATVAQHQSMARSAEAISTQAITLYSSLNTGQQAIVVAAAQARYLEDRQR